MVNNIRILVNKEAKAATNAYGEFNSAHEGYAVILEEFEEAKENIQLMEDNLKMLWEDIKKDISFVNDARDGGILTTLEENAIDLIQEAIQIAAMIKKFQRLQEL